MGRLWRKQRKLEARLNWIAGDVPDRPKGMRCRTFERILDQIDSIEAAKDVEFVARVAAEFGPHLGLAPEVLSK